MTTTYHIHWEGQPQPDATPWTSLDAARDAAITHARTNEQFTITAIGSKGWPHEYETVFSSADDDDKLVPHA